MNDREKDEETVVTYFTKQYRNVPGMTTSKHKKTENNRPPCSPNRTHGVTIFITPVTTVLGVGITFLKKQVSFNELKTTVLQKKTSFLVYLMAGPFIFLHVHVTKTGTNSNSTYRTDRQN
jgi:hypothetical protein